MRIEQSGIMHRSLTYCLFLLSVAACAASTVVDTADDATHQRAPVDVGDVDADTETPGDVSELDAADQAVVPDGHDAALPSHVDALTSADAAPVGQADAGHDAMVSKPASATGLPGLPGLPALPGLMPPDGLALPRPLPCMTAAECTKECFPVGVVSCCRPDHVCGCSWAPGAYCL